MDLGVLWGAWGGLRHAGGGGAALGGGPQILEVRVLRGPGGRTRGSSLGGLTPRRGSASPDAWVCVGGLGAQTLASFGGTGAGPPPRCYFQLKTPQIRAVPPPLAPAAAQGGPGPPSPAPRRAGGPEASWPVPCVSRGVWPGRPRGGSLWMGWGARGCVTRVRQFLPLPGTPAPLAATAPGLTGR